MPVLLSFRFTGEVAETTAEDTGRTQEVALKSPPLNQLESYEQQTMGRGWAIFLLPQERPLYQALAALLV